MKFDFYTGAIDFTGIGFDSGFGYGVGKGLDHNPYLQNEVIKCTSQGKANGECDKMGNNYG